MRRKIEAMDAGFGEAEIIRLLEGWKGSGVRELVKKVKGSGCVIKVGSLSDLSRKGFEGVGCGFYKKGHKVWRLVRKGGELYLEELEELEEEEEE